jgi:hypothetical protein
MAFTGTLDKCKACDKTVYVVDMMSLEGVPYHKSCFKCSHCKGTLVVCFPFWSSLSIAFLDNLSVIRMGIILNNMQWVLIEGQ